MLVKLLIALCLIQTVHASSLDNIKKYDWNGIEVVHLVDNRFPTYDLAVYFADGALADGSNKGLTAATLGWLDLGTRRYTQKDIADNLEFFAVSHGASVNHEYSLYTVSGLVKDIKPTMKKICHLFADATFPIKELKKEKRRARQNRRDIINSKGALASMVARELSMKGNPIAYPVSGKLADINKWTQKKLKNHLQYFNKNVKKKIYISGPDSTKTIEKIVTKDCGWNGEANYARSLSKKAELAPSKIYLVTVPKANQAQIRIGRLLKGDIPLSQYELDLASNFLGGGFTSRLMRVLRTGHGLVYSAGAYASMQNEYGRAGISTSTKNENLEKLLNLTKSSIEEIASGNVPAVELSRAKGLLAASFPFRFERSSTLLGQLIDLDHRGKSFSTLQKYPQEIYDLEKDDLSKSVKEIFDWSKQVIVIVGTKNLKKQLSKFGKVTVIPYQKFL